MSTTNEKNRFCELSKKADVPVNIVELLLEENLMSDDKALRLLAGIRLVKVIGIKDEDKEVLFNGSIFERIGKLFQILDSDTLSYLPYVTANMATQLGHYWCDEGKEQKWTS